MHPLNVVVAQKSKIEVSPGVAQTGVRLTLDDATHVTPPTQHTVSSEGVIFFICLFFLTYKL